MDVASTGRGGDRRRARDRAGDRPGHRRARPLGRRQLPLRRGSGRGDLPRGRGAADRRDAVAIRADVSDPAEGRRLLDEAMAVAGRIDLWVNNAGIAPERRLDLLETTPESWDRVLGTNLRGPFFLTQAVARAMIGLRPAGIVAEPQIVFITSISSRFASITRGEYCVAKAGLSMVAQLFAARLAGQGIRVYEVRPGLIDTDMTRAGPGRLRRADRRRARSRSGAGGRPRTSAAPSRRSPPGAFPYSTGDRHRRRRRPRPADPLIELVAGEVLPRPSIGGSTAAATAAACDPLGRGRGLSQSTASRVRSGDDRAVSVAWLSRRSRLIGEDRLGHPSPSPRLLRGPYVWLRVDGRLVATPAIVCRATRRKSPA